MNIKENIKRVKVFLVTVTGGGVFLDFFVYKDNTIVTPSVNYPLLK